MACFLNRKIKVMQSNHLHLHIAVDDKKINGFCMRIHDEFHETYAVILDGYHSFCVWHDQYKTCWKTSNAINIDQKVLDKIIFFLQSNFRVSSDLA